MPIRRLTADRDLAAYDAWVKAHPQGSLWQSLEWKRYQEALGREVRIYSGEGGGEIRASALVVIDRTTGGLCMWEIPRGPLGAVSGQESVINLLEVVVSDAKKDRCLSLFLSPATQLTTDHSPLATPSSRHQQPEATILLDLTLTDEQLLAQMHPKARYNIRLAQRKGVGVRQSGDANAFFQLMKRTAERDGFTHLAARSYEAFLTQLPGAFLFLAYAPGTEEPVAGLLGVMWNKIGIYYYGGSDHQHRALQAPSLLQWHAMRLCREGGCRTYDLFGIAPPVTSGQEPVMSKNKDSIFDIQHSTFDAKHPWASVTDFKRKFGGTIITYPPERQIVLRPVTHALLKVKRMLVG